MLVVFAWANDFAILYTHRFTLVSNLCIGGEGERGCVNRTGTNRAMGDFFLLVKTLQKFWKT